MSSDQSPSWFGYTRDYTRYIRIMMSGSLFFSRPGFNGMSQGVKWSLLQISIHPKSSNIFSWQGVLGRLCRSKRIFPGGVKLWCHRDITESLPLKAPGGFMRRSTLPIKSDDAIFGHVEPVKLGSGRWELVENFTLGLVKKWAGWPKRDGRYLWVDLAFSLFT